MQLDPNTALDLSVLNAAPTGPLGVAVSGGGDSVALLHLLNAWGGRALAVVTVDHGLRNESADEATAVGILAEAMGYPHDILRWNGWDGKGNLQDAARTARRSLMSDWAQKKGVGAIALGHTADDQAETFLMRLSRGSGVDGLSSMEPVHVEDGISWIRPMLGIRRETLRGYLRGIGAEYVDDPSNEDETFDRVKMRQALGTLDALGIDVPKINKTTERLRSAKQVVYTATRDLSLACAEVLPVGAMKLDLDRLQSAQKSLQLRVLSESLRHISGSYYAPRAYMVENILQELEPGFQARTLHGCILRMEGNMLIVRREPGKTGEPVSVGEIWDGRWKVEGAGDGQIKALGEDGLLQCREWRGTGWDRESLLTTPSVWQSGQLVSAPFAGLANGWTASLSLKNPFFTP